MESNQATNLALVPIVLYVVKLIWFKIVQWSYKDAKHLHFYLFIIQVPS